MIVNRSSFKEYIFIILISLFIFEYQLTLVHSFFIDRVIKLGSFILIILFFRIIRDNIQNIYIKNFFLIYAALFLIMVISFLLNLSSDAAVSLVKYSLLLSLVLILLYMIHPHYFSDRIIKFPILIGVVFSINSIILWVLIYSGYEPYHFSVSTPRLSRLESYSYLWGDMRYALGNVGSVSRACGFFTTPNRYGSFLLYPIFVSYGYFVTKKRPFYLLACALCSVALVMTFSFGAILGCAAALTLGFFFRMTRNIKGLKKLPIIIGICGFLLSLILLMGIFNFYRTVYLSDDYYLAKAVFRGGGYESLFHAFVSQSEAYIPDLNKPFGNGLGYHRDGALYTPQYGFVMWILLLGYPGAIVFLVFIAYMFKVHVFPSLMDRSKKIEQYVALAWVAQTLIEMEEGGWITSYYLFTTAILILLKTYTFRERKKTKIKWLRDLKAV